MWSLPPTSWSPHGNLYQRLQQTHVAGILNYDLFTVAEGYSLLVLEQAFAERFVDYYQGRVPLINKKGEKDYLVNVTIFDQVYDALNRGGSHARGSWKVLSLNNPGAEIEFSGTFRTLLDWARHEGLLHGQRFRRLEDFIVKVRNAAAHPTSYSRRANLDSARSIREVGEVINRIWGFRSPGGRIFPAPAKPEIILPCWDLETSTLSSNRASDLSIWTERKTWQFIAVMAFGHDDSVWHFHSDFEATVLPAYYLWGPGTYEEALEWLATVDIEPEEVDYLDRHFVVRVPSELDELPRNVRQLAGLPEQSRDGRWLLLKADFPVDTHAHGRAVANQIEGHDAPSDGFCKACCVEVEADGDWNDVMTVAERMGLDTTPQPPRRVTSELSRFPWF